MGSRWWCIMGRMLFLINLKAVVIHQEKYGETGFISQKKNRTLKIGLITLPGKQGANL